MFRVIIYFLLLFIYMLMLVDQLPRLGKRELVLSAVVYLLLCGFCLERFPLPLGAWDRLRYFIVALLEPSI